MSTRHGELLYVIGPPASGKSTLMARLVAGCPVDVGRQPFRHERYPGAVQLGSRREAYPGTDTLALNAQPRVLDWLATAAVPLILAEGDRLANGTFFRAVVALGYRLTVVWLDCPWEETVRRVQLRPAPQPLSWVRGRATKVARLGAGWVLPRWHLDALAPCNELVERVRQHPAVRDWRRVAA